MHSVDIYRGISKLVTVKPDESSVQKKVIMGDNFIQLDFTLQYEAKFKLHDWCTVFGEKYYIAKNPPPVTKKSKNKFAYSLQMTSDQFQLERVQYLFLGSGAYTLYSPEFSLMGKPQTFIDLILQNTPRILSGWSSADVIDGPYKNLTFSTDTCLSALSKIAEAYETEWWVFGNKIYLTKIAKQTGITLKHGRARGLYEIIRQPAGDSRVSTYAYVYGGKKNLPYDYGFPRLRIMPDHPEYPSYVGCGSVNEYGLNETTFFFDDIYPHRTGKVTGVDATNPKKFTDSTMDFDLNAYTLGGTSPKVVFNTGQLSGYQFEVSRYDNGTKEIFLLKNADETSLDIPSDAIRPAIGDEYVFIDIKLPQSYIAAAELELLKAAIAEVDKTGYPQYSFSITLDPVYVRNNLLHFAIGDLVWITDSDLEIDREIRVTGVERGIVKETQYTLTLADTVQKGTIASINSNISSVQRDVNQVQQVFQSNVIFNGRMIVPETTDVSGMSPLYIDNATDKIYKKV